jgi:hypothetical protein
METYKIASTHIVSEIFADEEAAVINLKSGNYYSLNKTGAEIWRQIEDGFALEQIIESLRRRYISSDNFDTGEVERFVRKLKEEGLIVAVESDFAPQSDLLTQNNISEITNAYKSPSVETYADMQELLLLDPIHEVEENNWLNK